MAGNTTNVTLPLTRVNCTQALVDVDALSLANIILLLVLFISLGMTISIPEAKRVLKKPRGVFIAQVGQFALLPLIGWGMAMAFKLPIPAAVGLVAITTAPGGAVSNVIATFYQADVPLSIISTAVSSIVAIGLMPLNQYIYLIVTNLAPGVCLNVSGIILSAFIVVAGTSVGLCLKPFLQHRQYFKAIHFLYLAGSLAGLAIVILGFVANLNSNMPITALPGNMIAASIIPYILGCSLGLIMSKLAGLEPPSIITVMLEIGIQNKSVAISVLTFIFPANNSLQRAASLAIPILYALFATVLSIIWVGIAWKLGFTNLPKDKGFIEAFKIARQKAAEAHEKDVYGTDNHKQGGVISENSSAGQASSNPPKDDA